MESNLSKNVPTNSSRDLFCFVLAGLLSQVQGIFLEDKIK